MLREIAIPFARPLRNVVPVDPQAPLPPSQGAAAQNAAAVAELEKQRLLLLERQQIAEVLAALTQAGRSLQVEHRQRWAEMEHAAVELAVAIAERLIHRTIETGDFAVEALVRSIVARLDGDQAATVFLHPDDLALLRRRLPEEPVLAADSREVRLAADPALGRGHCRARVGEVNILSRLDVQLADIHQHLRSALHEDADPGKAQT